MTTPPEAPPLSGEKPCLACAEPIQAQAIICRHCKTRQNWTRYLLNWKEIIGAVMAILPLWGGAYALLMPRFQDNAPQLGLVDVSCSPASAMVLVSNGGRSPAIIRSLSISGAGLDETYRLVPNAPGEGVIEVAEDTIRAIPVAATLEGVSAPLPQSRPGTSLRLTLDYVDYGGVAQAKTVPWSC